MPMPSALVTMFFQLLVNRKFADAQRELERIKQKMQKTEWNRGYSRALHGMLIARRSNSDQYLFLSKLDPDDKKLLQDYRKEFRRHVRNKLHGDFDRGYFSAWADCMRVLNKLTLNPSMKEDPSSENEKSESVGKDERQTKIEPFLKGKR